MKFNKEKFFDEWDLKLMQQIKTGDTIISEVNFAVPKSCYEHVWQLMNNGQFDFKELIKVALEFDLDIGDSGMIYRLTQKTKVNKSNKMGDA